MEMTQVDLDVNSPCNPERAVELAQVVAQATACLEHATVQPYPGVGWPVQLADLISPLMDATHSSTKLYLQIADAILARELEGQLVLPDPWYNGADLTSSVGQAATNLHEAVSHMLMAVSLLIIARVHLGQVSLRDPGDQVGGEGQADK
jgi:hypothetical protein